MREKHAMALSFLLQFNPVHRAKVAGGGLVVNKE